MFHFEKCTKCNVDVLTFNNVLNLPFFMIIWYLMNCDTDEFMDTHDCGRIREYDKEKVVKMNAQLFLLSYVHVLSLKENTGFLEKEKAQEECTVY